MLQTFQKVYFGSLQYLVDRELQDYGTGAGGIKNMWYAIQTITGNEEEAAEGIKKMVDAESYEDCFLLKREAVWRIQGICRVHVERLFPGYVFISTQHPKEVYQQLKRVSSIQRCWEKRGRNFIRFQKKKRNF